jgi:hypothetical protein
MKPIILIVLNVGFELGIISPVRSAMMVLILDVAMLATPL